ncbi:MAG: glycosyltransferase family 2 protein [Verrucomicrobia bacterium]|nr:glycosyltransferase family 2 protein [Verrucomicrobiota bacterium]
MDCAAIIPCFNEAAAIGPLVSAVRRHLPCVLVVDDGSTDGTAAAARNAGAEVLLSVANQGKGAALRTGLRRAGELGCTWALLLDGDGQHDTEDIPAFLSVSRVGLADLVIGNRMAAPGEMPRLRRLINRVMSAVLSALSGTQLPDTQCGFRLVRLSGWEALPLRCTGFEVESEILLAHLADGRRVEFIPVRSRYKSEQSKIRPFRDTLRWLAWLWRARGEFARARGSHRIPLAHGCLAKTSSAQMEPPVAASPASPARKVAGVLARIAGFVCMAFLMGTAMDWSARRTRPDLQAGFWWGVVHGALMPATMPTLLTGKDVAIYAPHNTGVTYKLGYTMGVNGCGAIFFGLMFLKPKEEPNSEAG